MTQAFLDFSLERGNDLVTPRPQWRFAGLKAGDRWCVCLGRWVEQRDFLAQRIFCFSRRGLACGVVDVRLRLRGFARGRLCIDLGIGKPGQGEGDGEVWFHGAGLMVQSRFTPVATAMPPS